VPSTAAPDQGRPEALAGAGLPFTQSEIGDSLGLSTVHVNRTLQEDLRAADLITLTKNKLTVNDWEGLKALGEFDPTYLHQKPREAA
jgi:hypothetical protein